MKTNTMKSLFAAAVVAASALHVAPARAAYEIGDLRKLYENGKLPAAADLQAVWVGRCFLDSEVGAPVSGAMFIGNNPENHEGPLFPAADGVWFRIAEGSAEEFDDFNAAKDSLPPGSIDDEGYPRSPARVEDGSFSVLMGNWGDWSSQWKIRQSGKNLIALQYIVKPKRDDARRIALKRACYFFKKVF